MTTFGDRLVSPLQGPLERAAEAMLTAPGVRRVDFASPLGDAPPSHWFIGGGFGRLTVLRRTYR
ncbi:MAG: hypothetical protein K2Q06_02925 [Parvularculaceae bacterium]|nr:hypothetical protein [Parvularculaceae bacterium]